ncbi:MAG: GspE/PulE family protein [Aquabacterium sp.]
MNAPLPPIGLRDAAVAEALALCLGDGRAGPHQVAFAAFDLWGPADAQRWRVVLARDAQGAILALCDTAAAIVPLLRSRLEGLVAAPVRCRVCAPAAIDALLAAGAAAYRAVADLDTAPLGGDRRDATRELSAQALAGAASPVVRLLDATIYDALHDGASDVHFECSATGVLIRCRLDGVMQTVREVPGLDVAEQLISRLKIMAELDIGERRLPQDGRFKLQMGGRVIDFRLSVMPSVFGEDAVVRVLDRAGLAGETPGAGMTLAALGFDPALRERLLALASQPHGLLLVTGPTGSGKTTTLYAVIGQIHRGDDKIVTIEDPVEYQLAGVVQIPVNERKGLTFARGLRSILRHDPDRVMVGEIRDTETAQIAVQAALTGHMVFSTVHANGAFDVVGRFMHMGLDLHNVVAALNAVLAQRLVRRLCAHCAVPLPGASTSEGGPRMAVGCPHCRHTGYRGRQAVSELLVLNDELRELIAARAPLSQLRAAAAAQGMVSLRTCAQDLVRQGLTTQAEIDRVTRDA